MKKSTNFIATSFDGKNYWPVKILKRTAKRATVIECNIDGKEIGEPITKNIDDFAGEPTIQKHRFEIVYLDRPYEDSLFLSHSDI